MPGDNGEPRVQLQEVFGLLFAVLCGMLLGLAAAPSALPMLGFAGPGQYVESRRDLQTLNPRGNRIPRVAHAVSASAPRPQDSRNQSPSRRSLANRPSSASALAGTDDTASSPLAFVSLQPITLFGLALLALVVVIWLRRDMFTVLLCRWAKNPRQWNGTVAPAVVNARCVVYLEGNAYQLGGEFFTQPVEVRFSPLFVRINARGSSRAIVLPRRMPRIAPANTATRRVVSN